MVVAKKLLRNFIVLLAGNVIGQILSFVGLAYLARVLGPSGFGVWNFAQVLMLYLLRVGEFGLEVVGIRETSRDPRILSPWIATVVSIRFLFALVLFGLTLLVSKTNLLPDGTSSLVLISALAVFPMALLLEWVFESRQEVGLISLARILKGLLFFLGIFFMVSNKADVERAAYLYVASLVIPGLLIFSMVVRRFGSDWSSISYRKIVEALAKSAPIGIASLLSMYSLSLATLVVGYLLSKEELGFFTAAHRIVLFLWAYVITSMHRIILPGLSRSFQESLPHFQQFVEKCFRLSALVALPIGLVGTLCGVELMRLLYSVQYEASGAAFGILLWAFIFSTIRSILEIALIASDRQAKYMKGILFLSTIHTVLIPILTLKFGIIGTSVAVVGAELAYFIYLVITTPYSKPAFLWKNLWKPLLAVFSAMVATLPFVLQPLLRLGVGTTVFGVLIVALKGMSPGDLAAVKSLFRWSHVEHVG